MDKYQFYSLPIQSTVVWHECTWGYSTCIKRTLRMRSWLSVLITDAKSRKGNDIPIAPSLYSLGNKMDNSLLAVRDINHKYIVVEEADFLEEFDPRYNEEGVSELDEQFERLPDGHEAKRSYYLGFRQAQSEARPNIVISLLKLN